MRHGVITFFAAYYFGTPLTQQYLYLEVSIETNANSSVSFIAITSGPQVNAFPSVLASILRQCLLHSLFLFPSLCFRPFSASAHSALPPIQRFRPFSFICQGWDNGRKKRIRPRACLTHNDALSKWCVGTSCLQLVTDLDSFLRAPLPDRPWVFARG